VHQHAVRGSAWYGDGDKQYRTKPRAARGRYIDKALVESAVLDKLIQDLESPAFVRELTLQTKRHAAAQGEDPTQPVRARLKEINQRVSRMMDFTASLQDPGPRYARSTNWSSSGRRCSRNWLGSRRRAA
jgi:hypothetical protein